MFFHKPLCVTLLLTGAALGQPAPPQSELSPQAAYDLATRPLEITRRSLANWSEPETAALAVTVKQANDACRARTVEQFTGDDLVAYARLCSLGQQWPAVGAAAAKYIAGRAPKPQLTQAYSYQVEAALHTNDAPAILSSSQAMLHAVPYDSLVDETIRGSLRYLQLVYTAEALKLYADREPLVLQTLSTPRQPADTRAVPVHTLYEDELAFAALQQFVGEGAAAARTVAQLDAALPPSMQPDDSLPIEQSRRQYGLLGSHLPPIQLTMSLFAVGETPRINTNYGTSTALFLFPAWCAQCVRTAQQFRSTLYRLAESNVHLYGLLAQEAPPVAAAPPTNRSRTPAKDPATPEPPQQAVDLLRGSPTLIVPPRTLAQFGATDFPLLIATDSQGIVRFIQPASENVLNPGDLLDQVTSHIAQQWPRETPTRSGLAPGSAQP